MMAPLEIAAEFDPRELAAKTEALKSQAKQQLLEKGVGPELIEQSAGLRTWGGMEMSTYTTEISGKLHDRDVWLTKDETLAGQESDGKPKYKIEYGGRADGASLDPTEAQKLFDQYHDLASFHSTNFEEQAKRQLAEERESRAAGIAS